MSFFSSGFWDPALFATCFPPLLRPTLERVFFRPELPVESASPPPPLSSPPTAAELLMVITGSTSRQWSLGQILYPATDFGFNLKNVFTFLILSGFCDSVVQRGSAAVADKQSKERRSSSWLFSSLFLRHENLPSKILSLLNYEERGAQKTLKYYPLDGLLTDFAFYCFEIRKTI